MVETASLSFAIAVRVTRKTTTKVAETKYRKEVADAEQVVLKIEWHQGTEAQQRDELPAVLGDYVRRSRKISAAVRAAGEPWRSR